MKKFSLNELEQIKEQMNEKLEKSSERNENASKESLKKSKTQEIITMKFDDKTFEVKLQENSHKDAFRDYLANVKKTNKEENLKPKTQQNYLRLLYEFVRDELEPLRIAKSFDIYRVDPSSIKALEELHKQMNKLSSPLYKINKNDYRKFKNGKENKYCDKNIKNYLGGDPSASLFHYINYITFLKKT